MTPTEIESEYKFIISEFKYYFTMEQEYEYFLRWTWIYKLLMASRLQVSVGELFIENMEQEYNTFFYGK